jgi:hypothetical protein
VSSYNAIAEQYAEQYFDELDGKPFDRDVLDHFAATVKQRGRVCDLGCGPEQIAPYLAGHGVDSCDGAPSQSDAAVQPGRLLGAPRMPRGGGRSAPKPC